ncbi:hypothetical protein BC940DRAFT_235739 [Gongronella butleri]|nr:hypothetical protein BC940DRAFT_235739 [Gongronella butleri]
MSAQLGDNGIPDSHYIYRPDGLITANDLQKAEILIFEVSNSYNAPDAAEKVFDHCKAMFGSLSMLLTLADNYAEATFATFSKLKVHFVLAHGNAIEHWSMSTQYPGFYAMQMEQRVTVPDSFADKNVFLQPFICFFMTLAAACEETLSVLAELNEEHTANTRSNGTQQSLTKLMDPTIIQLNKVKHAPIDTDQGPQSGPASPDHD